MSACGLGAYTLLTSRLGTSLWCGGKVGMKEGFGNVISGYRIISIFLRGR